MSDPRDARKPAAPARPVAPPPQRPPPAKPGTSPRPPAVSGAVTAPTRPRMPTSLGLGSAPPPKKTTSGPLPAPNPLPAPKKAERDARGSDAPTALAMRYDPAELAAAAADESSNVETAPLPPVSPRVPSIPPPAAGLGAEAVRALVQSAVAEALATVLSRQRALEERLERSEASARGASLAVTPVAPAVALAAASPGGSGVTPSALPSVAPRAVKVSVPPNAYGVAVLETPTKRPDLDLGAVGPIDVPNFGGGGRHVGKLIAVVLVLLIASVVTVTVLSHT